MIQGLYASMQPSTPASTASNSNAGVQPSVPQNQPIAFGPGPGPAPVMAPQANHGQNHINHQPPNLGPVPGNPQPQFFTGVQGTPVSGNAPSQPNPQNAWQQVPQNQHPPAPQGQADPMEISNGIRICLSCYNDFETPNCVTLCEKNNCTYCLNCLRQSGIQNMQQCPACNSTALRQQAIQAHLN